MNEVIGILLHKLDERAIKDNFSVREFVVKTDHDKEYPQEVLFQLSNRNIDLIKDIPLGVLVKVSYQLKGKSYENTEGKKWFNTLQVWKIEKLRL